MLSKGGVDCTMMTATLLPWPARAPTRHATPSSALHALNLPD